MSRRKTARVAATVSLVVCVCVTMLATSARAQYSVNPVPDLTVSYSDPVTGNYLTPNHDYITGGLAMVGTYSSGTYSWADLSGVVTNSTAGIPSGWTPASMYGYSVSANGNYIAGNMDISDGSETVRGAFVYSRTTGSSTYVSPYTLGRTEGFGMTVGVNNSGVLATYATPDTYALWSNYENDASPFLPADGNIWGVTTGGWAYGVNFNAYESNNLTANSTWGLVLYKGGTGTGTLPQPTVDTNGVLQPTPDYEGGTRVGTGIMGVWAGNILGNDLGTLVFPYFSQNDVVAYHLGQYRDTDQTWHDIDVMSLVSPPDINLLDVWGISVAGVSADNKVAGTVSASYYTDNSQTTYMQVNIPFLYDPVSDTTVNLNTLLPLGSPSITNIAAISTDGWMMAGTSDSSAYLIAPAVVPEPSSMALLGIGLGGLAFVRSRRRRKTAVAA